MAYFKQFSMALGLLATASLAAPALAHDHEAGLVLAQNHAPSQSGVVEAASEAVPETSSETASEAAVEATVSESAEPATAEFESVHSTASLLTLPEVGAVPQANLFDNADIETALLAATVELAPEGSPAMDLAQGTRPTDGISPAYVGVGGNIGLGNRGNSALSSFGFNIISKISLGPRFSVRAGATATNDRWGFTIPLTYNFNTIGLQGFRAQPYVGAGVEIPTSGDIGFLVNAGADVPISRDFTLNGAANIRLTSGFALGISLGVGYNFPFIFE